METMTTSNVIEIESLTHSRPTANRSIEEIWREYLGVPAKASQSFQEAIPSDEVEEGCWVKIDVRHVQVDPVGDWTEEERAVVEKYVQEVKAKYETPFWGTKIPSPHFTSIFAYLVEKRVIPEGVYFMHV